MISKRPVTVGLAACVAMGVILLGSACGSPTTGEAVELDAGAVQASQPTMAPDVTLNTLSGDATRLSDWSGKVRLVDFWATWCAPCREEIPMLNDLQATYGDRGFQVLAISDEDVGLIREFVDEHGVQYLNLVGSEEVNEAFGVLGLPAAYLVDGEGRLIDSFIGPKPRRVLVKKIEALLDGTPAT